MAHPDFSYSMQIYHDSKWYYIVTDFFEGGPLSDRLASQGKLSEANVLTVVIQVLKILNYLHGKGIAINGLSLSHIMLKQKDTKVFNVKLTDCGTT